MVSDVHAAADALAGAGGADMLICLGDLLLFLDYADPGQGVYAELYGAEYTRQYIELRLAKRFDEARELTRRLMAEHARSASGGTDSSGGGLRGPAEPILRRQYQELFAALPSPAYLTYGNVDVPDMWAQYLRPGQQVIDGGQVRVGGHSFGFAGGGLISPYHTPNEVPEEAFRAKLDAMMADGPVDVVCTHIPPAIPELLYDTVARRLETGSVALLDLIRRAQPRYAVFGHVHQPLARRVRVGRTECVNVGHFRATKAPYVLQL
ncbi:MAG TPA: metallophosphoesterase [Trebonia sp.]|nr:metallophosphoesterase [Trebonia sp.]